MFSWAMQRGIVEASPVAAVRPPGREVARDRVLAPDELAALGGIGGIGGTVPTGRAAYSP